MKASNPVDPCQRVSIGDEAHADVRHHVGRDVEVLVTAFLGDVDPSLPHIVVRGQLAMTSYGGQTVYEVDGGNGKARFAEAQVYEVATDIRRHFCRIFVTFPAVTEDGRC